MTSPVLDAGDDLPLTIPALWRKQVLAHADKILLANEDTRLSYAEADQRSRQLARGLLAAGAIKGSHVALLFPNGPDFVVGMLAAARIGAVVVPLSTLSTADELRWLLKHSDSAFLLAAQEFRSRRYVEVLAKALPELDFSRPPPQQTVDAPWLRRIWFSGPVAAGIDEGWSLAALEALGDSIDTPYLEAVEERVSPADRLVMIHTSGSTARPKAVLHTHGTLIRHLDNANQIRQLHQEDVLFSTAPWFWVAGYAAALTATIVAGARIVDSKSTIPSEALDMLERERPTITNGYSASVAKLVADPSFEQRDLSSIRRGTIWAILAPEVRPADYDLRLGNYGMTEVGGSMCISGYEGDLPEHKRGAFGPFMPGFEYKFVDPETGEVLPQGEVGELLVRGPFLMEDYYGKPRSQVFEPDGWWRTGDFGCVDEDGYYYFKGRRDDMIKTAGANVAPREVEAVIREITGGMQCFVIGVPDERRGQIVVAIAIAESDGDLNEDSLKQQLANKLSSYKVPRHIFRLSSVDIPTLPNGKLDMKTLRTIAETAVKNRVIGETG